MRTGKPSKLHILFLAVLLLVTAYSAVAEGEEPLTLMVESDPECLLSEAGDMTYFRFTVKNDLDEDYTLEDMTLQGDLLAARDVFHRQVFAAAVFGHIDHNAQRIAASRRNHHNNLPIFPLYSSTNSDRETKWCI